MVSSGGKRASKGGRCTFPGKEGGARTPHSGSRARVTQVNHRRGNNRGATGGRERDADRACGGGSLEAHLNAGRPASRPSPSRPQYLAFSLCGQPDNKGRRSTLTPLRPRRPFRGDEAAIVVLCPRGKRNSVPEARCSTPGAPRGEWEEEAFHFLGTGGKEFQSGVRGQEPRRPDGGRRRVACRDGRSERRRGRSTSCQTGSRAFSANEPQRLGLGSSRSA